MNLKFAKTSLQSVTSRKNYSSTKDKWKVTLNKSLSIQYDIILGKPGSTLLMLRDVCNPEQFIEGVWTKNAMLNFLF